MECAVWDADVSLLESKKKELCQTGCINQDSALCYTDYTTSVQSDTVHLLHTRADVTAVASAS